MKMTDQKMSLLITQHLEHLADRCAYHAANGDFDLVDLLKQEGLMLAEAYDDHDIILIAEALF